VDTVPKAVWDDVREVDVGARDDDPRVPGGARHAYCGSALYASAPSRERLGVAEVLGDAELELTATNDVFWDEVVSVEADGVEEVFDATVLGWHNFIANGIAVHNSIEQDADMVILLHRDRPTRARRGGRRDRGQAPKRPDQGHRPGVPGPLQPVQQHGA
jgi:replicative DNA helicase